MAGAIPYISGTMTRPTPTRRPVALLTVLAILLTQTLAPALAAAKAAPMWMEICAADGSLRLVPVPGTGDTALDAGPHCPFCLGPAWAPGTPPPAVTARPAFVAPAFAVAPETALASAILLAHPPRGPPVA